MKSTRLRLLAAVLLFLVPAAWVLHNSYPPLPSPLVFDLELSEGKPGQAGPLIVTGHPSAGDFLFVKWLEKNRVVFCYNSWGKTEVLESAPVTLEPGQRLHLSVAMPSVTPNLKGKSPKDKPLRVECNGVTVLEALPHFYPTEPDALAFGKNLFGKTLCGNKLAGQLFQKSGSVFKGGPASFFSFSERLGAWISGCWWQILGLTIPAFLFFRLAEPPPASRRSKEPYHPVDSALLRFSRYIFRIQTPAFAVGLALSLILLSYAGRRISARNYIEDFHRFYPQINVETYFYPSSSLFKSIAESQADSGQTLVIIGGSSVFNGVGQPVDKIWTDALQKELGPSYRVLNFAFRGGHPTDTGAIAAEMLRKEGRRVIYVADLAPGFHCEPDGRDVYRYVFWDAYYKGFLTDYPERREHLKTRVLNGSDRELLDETKLAMWLNSVFYSLDLWNYIAYDYVLPVWTNWASPFYQPRRETLDPEIDPGPLETRYLNNQDAEMNIIRGTMAQYYKDRPLDSLDLNPAGPGNFKTQPASNFAQDIRGDTILVTTGPSPFYRKKLSPIENERLKGVYRFQSETQDELGFGSVNATNALDEADYADRVHLAPSGGEKVARLVAAKIKEMDSKKEVKSHEK